MVEYPLIFTLLHFRPGSAATATVDICSPRLNSRPRNEDVVTSINQPQVRRVIVVQCLKPKDSSISVYNY